MHRVSFFWFIYIFQYVYVHGCFIPKLSHFKYLHKGSTIIKDGHSGYGFIVDSSSIWQRVL